MARAKPNYYDLHDENAADGDMYNDVDPQSQEKDLSFCPDSSNTSTLVPRSPRTPYAILFDRPFTSQSLPTSPRTPRYNRTPPQTKNMGDLVGTMTEAEYEALPMAVQRKYFSTLERLRFAQGTRVNELCTLPVRKPSLAERRGKRSPILLDYPHRLDSQRSRNRLTKKAPNISPTETSWFLVPPTDETEGRHATSDRPSASAISQKNIILFDAADENIRKASRRSQTSTLNSSRNGRQSSSISSCGSTTVTLGKAMLESFRWIDEENDMDLSIGLDDYHANIDGAVIPNADASHPRRPSYRRNMSVSQSPFGLASPNPSVHSPDTELIQAHIRNRSRTMSLMSPRTMRHVTKGSPLSPDAPTAHYQDPEARLKLRVYLASPQKFDEAIEFGFPSIDVQSEAPQNETALPRKTSRETRSSRSLRAGDSQTFLEEDNISLCSNDDASMLDPDSPVTPAEPDDEYRHQLSVKASSNGLRDSSSNDFSHLGIRKPQLYKSTDNFLAQISGNREMTLRMTLTRPDLRAADEQLYGWQEKHTAKEKPRAKSPFTEETFVLNKASTELSDKMGPYGGPDGWGPEKENGVVKRIWNKVRIGQRKTS